MSTDFRTEKKIRIADLFDGRLLELGVQEHRPSRDADGRCLTDGQNFLWASHDDMGAVVIFTRYASYGNPTYILETIAEVFQTRIYSEHEPQYWGFETEAELSAALEAESERIEREFYQRLVKHLRGERQEFETDFDRLRAELAKTLVDESPQLLEEDRREALKTAVAKAYRRHSVETSEVPF
jgi:hypothetical protein